MFDVQKHLRNLKFQYLEQSAKKKYLVTIMSDEAPFITSADNDAVKAVNDEKKNGLREAKERLKEKYEDIQALAPMVEQGSKLHVSSGYSSNYMLDYNKALASTSEASSMSQKILDAQLALTRWKQSYPEPRLTVSSATTQLESQVAEMQGFYEELQSLKSQVVSVKESMKKRTMDLERLKAKRAELEKLKVSKEDGSEDPRFAGLYDWQVFIRRDNFRTNLHAIGIPPLLLCIRRCSG